MSPAPAFDGDRLRGLRRQRELSGAALARETGLSTRQISLLETDQSPNVRAVTLARIALALNTSVDYLVGLADEPEIVAKQRNDGLPGQTPKAWLMPSVHLRGYRDGDLIEYLLTSPDSHSAIIREAVGRAVQQIGLVHHDPPNPLGDMRVAVQFRYDTDGRSIAYLRSLPSGQRSVFVRQALRRLAMETDLRREIVTRLKGLREEIEQGGEKIADLETTFALALSDVCNALGLTAEEHDEVLEPEAAADVAAILDTRIWLVETLEERETVGAPMLEIAAVPA